MKTVTLPLEFVKEAHKAACNDWKKRIEEHVPELAEPEIEVGKWYKGNFYNSDTLICIEEIERNVNFKGSISQKHYGFINGFWREKASWSNTSWSKDLIPATEKEVETALIAEAQRRGFKEGNYKGLESLYVDSKFTGWCYQSSLNKLYSADEGDGGDVIFHNGKWAEIIENPIPNKLQELIEEYGKEKIKEYLK